MSASPTAAAATPSVTATRAVAASPSPTAASATDRYGYVFTAAPGRIVVRRERDAAPVFELAGIAPAVSPDGKRLAYWRTTPTNLATATGFTPGGTELRALEVADPASDRSVFTVSEQTLGGNLVWSNDGQGLLVTTYSRETAGPPGGPPGSGAPAQFRLFTLDLNSTPPGMRSAADPVRGGLVYLPVA